ncbi:MAG TPA: response regulator [Kiritimatiellia bacterium]|nr:response regulator [Kiritimatiellia bacterium]
MWLRRKKTILIVDDEEDFGFFVKANLEARGSYRVRIATSSEQGIELALRYKPVAILLDIMMPRVDGFQTLKRLKEQDRTMFIPVIMLTAKHDDESRISAAGLYCDGYLTKPVKIDDLVARLDKVLGMRESA